MSGAVAARRVLGMPPLGPLTAWRSLRSAEGYRPVSSTMSAGQRYGTASGDIEALEVGGISLPIAVRPIMMMHLGSRKTNSASWML